MKLSSSLHAILSGALVLLGANSSILAIEIETVLVGNAGNAPDNRTMNDTTCCYGAVPHEYRIGKYEVTNDQFAAFLNAVAWNGDTYQIYEPYQMGGAHYGGILVSGGGGSNYVYTVKPNMGNKPVGGVSNGAARRFVNWLHNGQPTGNQVPGVTETGVYDLTGENWQTRSSDATWFLPTENEWYKAAYHYPTQPGGYALYATGSLFSPPTIATADSVGNVSNPGVNVATYMQGANWNGSAPFGHVTSVGTAGPLSASYYGTYDQSGNANEWTENVSIRGGHFGSLADQLSAEVRFGNAFLGYAGLRVASIIDPPDPSGGLQAYWNAENGATDVTGNGHDGTFQGNAATVASGPFGNAFSFDGSGDYIAIGDELDMATSDFTLAAWINGDPTMNDWGRIFDKGYASGYAFGKRSNTTNIAFEYLASGSQGNAFGTTSSLIDNTWHHVALIKSGTTVAIYADGAVENSETVSGGIQNTANPLLIGFNPGEGIMGYWKGLLDELRIYDRALTPAEIALLAMNPEEGLPGDFNFDGSVDAADYVVWRKLHSGDESKYNEWRTNFGRTSGSGAFSVDSGTTPEPSCGTLMALAGVLMAVFARRA
jgi:formylglycine-generating enzyme required for sulfatase activity